MAASKFDFNPLTSDRWEGFEELFGEKGACGGCWCMYWRLAHQTFEKGKGLPNKNAMKKLVRSGIMPGMLAYDGDQAIGWCAFAPRKDYSYLERSRVLKPLDNRNVWSISCFFIHKDYRKKGVSVKLLKASVDYIRQQGGTLVEGYPVISKKGEMPAAFAWTGLPRTFLKAGFEEVARPSPTRPIMRKRLRPKRKKSLSNESR